MKKHTILALMAAAILGMSPVSYAAEQEATKQEATKQETAKPSAEEVRQKLNEAAEAIKNYSADKRDEAAKTAKAALDTLDARINELEADLDKDWDKMDQAARERGRSTLKALQEQRVKVAERYGVLQAGTISAWEHIKNGFVEAYQAMLQAWEKAEREREKDEKK